MITLESIQSSTSQDASLVINKPTSLAVGDFMVAGVWVNFQGTGTVGVNTPSGWTLEENTTSAGNDKSLYVYSRIADSGDVAASNFTFVKSGSSGQYHMIGHLARVTDAGIKSGETSNATASSGTTLTMTGFTPTRANSLYFAFCAVSDTSLATISSLSIATDNPTWTKSAENTVNDTSPDSIMAVYTASRPETTATGTFTFTVTAPSNNRVHGIAVAVGPKQNSSVTQETKINAYAFNPISETAIDAIVDEPINRVRATTKWTNESKPSTTWTNELK